MNENAIRDLISKDLSVLEEGLQLLNIEQFIPSRLGTRSFLDILARDRAGHWVIIEVKKTNAAAREAAHEVFKYVEAVQEHFGARNDEIRAIVVSVEWSELLVPFSRLLKETSIAISGQKLLLDDYDEGITVVPIEPIATNKGRYLAPWHELNLYHNKSSLDKGIASYDKCCKIKGIYDYVLVVLKAAEDFNQKAAEIIKTIAAELGIGGEDLAASGVFDLEHYEYILYFAPQMLSEEFCLDVIARDPELLDEVRGAINDSEEEAKQCVLHEKVYDVDPCPSRDYLEIGYAAKFAQKLLVDEGWTVERVLRRGIFERNALLSDDAIIEELKGSTGSSGRSFKRSINLANRAHVSSALEGLEVALEKNPAWLAQIRRVFDVITKETPDCNASINVFSPSSGIFTLYFMALDQGGMSHMPRYEIAVYDASGNTTAVFIGLMVPVGEPLDFDEVLKKYYDGRMGKLMFLASTGFYESRDADILDDLGLVYRTFRLDCSDGGNKWFELKDDRWKSFTPKIPFQPLQSYFDKQIPLLRRILDAIGSRMHGGFHDMS